MSKSPMPVLFISHGSPEIAVRETPAHRFLKTLGNSLPKPTEILVISAHWETDAPTVATTPTPETIYDFGPRFDQRLWDVTYDAPGAVELGARVGGLLEAATGERVAQDSSQGRDHGVWTPLHLMYPDRAIPVTQLSIQPALGPRHHYEIGAALRPLRDEGVLLIGSGAMTHNLSEFRGRAIGSDEPEWVAGFRNWMHDAIVANDHEALLHYRANAPFAERNHPEDEHLLPLFSALGVAGRQSTAARRHNSVEYGVIGMDVYQWSDA